MSVSVHVVVVQYIYNSTIVLSIILKDFGLLATRDKNVFETKKPSHWLRGVPVTLQQCQNVPQFSLDIC